LGLWVHVGMQNGIASGVVDTKIPVRTNTDLAALNLTADLPDTLPVMVEGTPEQALYVVNSGGDVYAEVDLSKPFINQRHRYPVIIHAGASKVPVIYQPKTIFLTVERLITKTFKVNVVPSNQLPPAL